VALSSVRVEMAIRRAVESDGGAPVLEISHTRLSTLMSHELSGYDDARSRLLKEFADAEGVSIAAAALRLDFSILQVDYTRAHH
jgi:hypothetical protein